ncbi:MAG: hypothetical protein IPK26_13610 [Planctomycetes bacterium]|nr:hypothetical protein [Planctomycetota bacterium]
MVRDFRAGNRADDSAAIARGFVRETEAPQLLGQLPMRLAGVTPAGDGGPDADHLRPASCTN